MLFGMPRPGHAAPSSRCRIPRVWSSSTRCSLPALQGLVFSLLVGGYCSRDSTSSVPSLGAPFSARGRQLPGDKPPAPGDTDPWQVPSQPKADPQLPSQAPPTRPEARPGHRLQSEGSEVLRSGFVRGCWGGPQRAARSPRATSAGCQRRAGSAGANRSDWAPAAAARTSPTSYSCPHLT